MMTAKQFQEHLDALGMTQRGAARFLDIGERSSRRFASKKAGSEVPRPIELTLRLMVEKGISPEEALALCKVKARRGFGDLRYAEAEE
jgi:hypothetical protein